MLRTTAGIEAGDVLQFWHNAGCMGHQLCYATVLKPCAKLLRVRHEQGREGIKPPEFFIGKVSAADVAELRVDGVRI